MTYAVKEIFFSLQGEGANSGRPAVFCRFAGCNLWNGHEEDRPQAICNFCDTDFLGTDGPDGGKFSSAADLARAVAKRWPETLQAALAGNKMQNEAGTTRDARGQKPLVILTGGEPLLQLDDALLDALHDFGFDVAIETNGTLPVPPGVDWICVSPKANAPWLQRSGNELKLIFPQPELDPQHLEPLQFDYFFLQPMDGPLVERNTRLALEYCLAHPRWRLSLQTHKLLGIR